MGVLLGGIPIGAGEDGIDRGPCAGVLTGHNERVEGAIVTTPPDPDLNRLRRQVDEQLSGWCVRDGEGTTGFTHGTGSRLEKAIRGRSCVDPRLEIVAELGSRNADNDGTFPAAPVYLVSFTVAAKPPEESGATAEVTQAECRSGWRSASFHWPARRFGVRRRMCWAPSCSPPRSAPWSPPSLAARTGAGTRR
ncbi:hypothetical protein GCM10010198_74910 [Nocardia seriolae]|nr:hypothetical protein NSERKGN1266_57530 [Nocardia seriolae]BEK94582.1 hypothetical protein NSER024013_24880 [Nocardia seriolae]GEM22976.1 hypothetical protein NS2_12150 [Nocardia seriolae NBRC 15557]